jgi:two-component system, LytTR family, response regulator AlgR
MMKILVVDDEPLARQRLTALVHETGIGRVVSELSSGKDIVSVVEIYHPDVVLLDIRMPGVDGMQAARQLEKLYPTPAIIFTTAFGDRALEAFDQQAVDYLLKPIRKDRLEKALRRAYSLLHSDTTQIPEQEMKATTRSHISANVRGNIVLIPMKDVYYFIAEEKYLMLHWSKGKVLVSERLRDLEQEFSGQLLRVHRSALVSVSQIGSMVKDNHTGHFFLKIKDTNISLEVSRRHLPIVRRILKDMHMPGVT